MVSAKAQAPKSSIVVYSDKGSLALRFSTKYNLIFEQLDGKPIKKQKCMGLGKLSDSDPKNWKEAQRIAFEIESDLNHKDWDKLFDPTLGKYGIGEAKYAKKLADVLNLPTAQVQWTVGKLWEDYLVWKEDQLEPNTFQMIFQGTFTNALKGLKWNNKIKNFFDTGKSIWELPLTPDIGEKALQMEIGKDNKTRLLLALNEAYNHALNLGYITNSKNPFFDLHKQVKESAKQKYQPKHDADSTWHEWWEFEDEDDKETEGDYRAFTKAERDIIIKAFYESKAPAKRHAATLIHFLFLTGCRPGEAFALRWKDVNFERGYIRFSKSYNGQTKNTGRTKTGEIRMFKLYPALTELLKQIKPENVQDNQLVFRLMNGNAFSSGTVRSYWNEHSYTHKGATYVYPGIVTQLANQGKITCYLKPYSTRHTFITMQANAGTDLCLLAAICGTSVEMIQHHYYGINKDAQVTDI